VIVVDTAPEFRLQSIRNGLNRVDAVLITHTHADHIFGLDDIRRFNDLGGQEIPLYADAGALEDIRRIFQYIFMPTPVAGGKPRIRLIETPEQFALCGLNVSALRVYHGEMPISAYRFNDMAYVTDVNYIPPETMTKLEGLELLILDAVRFKPHSTHFCLEQALEVIEHLRPQRALLTHICHDMDHDYVNSITPPNVEMAYDGLTINLQ
jgi:phosphoribosyl 1,2-cyclic phosphate phosphodiesterase